MARRWLICVAAICAVAPGCSKPTVAAKQNAAANVASDEADAAKEDAATSEEAAAFEPDAPADAARSGEPTTPQAGDRLLGAFNEPPKESPLNLAFEFDQALSGDDEAAAEMAASILGVTRQAIVDERVADYIDGVAKDNPAAAAKLVVWTTRAQFVLKQVERRNKTTGQGTIAVGRLVMSDGKFSPADVMFQVPITAEGYFATEIGNPQGALAFRAPGYEDLDAPLAIYAVDETKGDAVVEDDSATAENAAKKSATDSPTPPSPIVMGDVVMMPLAKDRAATLHGRAAPDDSSKAATAKVQLSLGMGPANTPHGGYSPRQGWPAPMTVEVDDAGEFDVPGLNPSEYSVSIAAADHAAFRKTIVLQPGEVHDAGNLRLRSTDLGFYVGAEAPDVPELAWEKDFETALQRAKRENRPLFIMMTATWCGPCKMLERDSLSNVWIRKFLEPFVVVQAFEDRDVEKKYDYEGYPTLVFANSAGESAFKSVGYQPAIEFAATVAKGLKSVEQDLPAELQTLIDKEVVTVE